MTQSRGLFPESYQALEPLFKSSGTVPNGSPILRRFIPEKTPWPHLNGKWLFQRIILHPGMQQSECRNLLQVPIAMFSLPCSAEPWCRIHKQGDLEVTRLQLQDFTSKGNTEQESWHSFLTNRPWPRQWWQQQCLGYDSFDCNSQGRTHRLVLSLDIREFEVIRIWISEEKLNPQKESPKSISNHLRIWNLKAYSIYGFITSFGTRQAPFLR